MTDTEVINRLRELGWNPTDENPVEIRFKSNVGISRTLRGIRRCPEGLKISSGIPSFGDRDTFVTVMLVDQNYKQYAPHKISEIYAFDKKAELLAEIARCQKKYQEEIGKLRDDLNKLEDQ